MNLKKLLGVFLSALVLLCSVSCDLITKYAGEIYNVTIEVNNSQWGSCNKNQTNLAKKPGDEVLFTAFPNPGYIVDRIDWLEEKDFEITEISENKWSFSMPSHNVTITIYFKAVEPDPEPEPEPELPKLAINDGNSINGIKLNFTNIPENAERRYIFLGSENDRIKIDEKAEWNNPDNVKDTTYFYPFTTKDKDYEFYVYYEKKDGTKLAEATVIITAKGGLGDFEVTNHENIKIAIDKAGNLSYETKPNVIENIDSEKQIVYCIQGWDSVSPWVNAGDAWLNDDEGYFWVQKWDWKKAGDAVTYDNFNVIDYICSSYSDKPETNIKVTDSLVKYKGLLLHVNYEIKNPKAENEWYTINIFDDQFFEKGKEGHGVYVVEPSPLLGTWMGESKAYTFTQNKVIVEDATSTNEYSYTYQDNLVQFNDLTFEYEIDEGRTKLSITEEDDTVKKYSRVCFGKKLEAGYEAAEIKVEGNVLKFVQAPGAKTIPVDATAYRVNIYTPDGSTEKWGKWIGMVDIPLTNFDDVDIAEAISKFNNLDKIIDNKITINVHWLKGENNEWYGYFASIENVSFTPSEEYLPAVVKVENNTIKFERAPGAKTIPEGITGYRVDFCTEGTPENEYGWLACATVDSLTYNDINVDDFVWNKTLSNNTLKIRIFWGSEGNKKVAEEVVISNYSVGSGYELPKTSIDGTVVTMTKPGSKLLAAYPKTHHYTVFVYSEANKWENWLGYKEFALTDDITFDLCDLGIDPYRIIDGKVNICLDLKGATETCEARLTDNNFVPFDGYKYHFTLSDNTIGMNEGISLNISSVPAEAKVRDVKIIIDNKDYEIHWTDDAVELASKTFTYPLVEANTEYEVQVNYYIKDEKGKQSTKIATSSFKTTPKGGTGSIIAVNAPDISGKIEGQNFVWVTKPNIRGKHTKGFVDVMFFNAEWYYIGGKYGTPYSKLQKDSYKGFSLADVNWNDEGKEAIKNLTTLNVLYKYNANDGSGDYDGLPCTVNENQQSFTGLSISIDLASIDLAPKPFTISFNGKQYAAGAFTTADDWESIEITFAEVPSTDQVQFRLISDSFEKEESWGHAYYSRYPQVAEVVTISLDDWLNNQPDYTGKTLAEQGATKITSVSIQAKTTETPDVKVKSAIVTKKDGTKEAVVAAEEWATIVTEN